MPTLEVQPSAEVSVSSASGGSRLRAAPAPKPSLNDRYTFDRLVVGANNQLAVAAASGRRGPAGQDVQPALPLWRGRAR